MDSLKIPQLRVCLTERCDKNCFYCRPTGEAVSSPNVNIDEINYDELISSIRLSAKLGISIVRLTGGEPMLYPQIYRLIKEVKSIAGINEVSLVTRSRTLKNEVKHLKQCGLDSITISLDSLDEDVLSQITGVNILSNLLEGIDECFKYELPVKINTVIMKGINDSKESISKFISFISNYKTITWKLLDYMILPNQDLYDNNSDLFVSLEEIKKMISVSVGRTQMRFCTQAGGLGSPMLNIEIKEGVIIQIKDSLIGSHYSSDCKKCSYYPCQDAIMALRLTSQGFLQKCLYRDDNLVAINSGDMKQFNEVINFYKSASFVANAWKPKV